MKRFFEFFNFFFLRDGRKRHKKREACDTKISVSKYVSNTIWGVTGEYDRYKECDKYERCSEVRTVFFDFRARSFAS